MDVDAGRRTAAFPLSPVVVSIVVGSTLSIVSGIIVVALQALRDIVESAGGSALSAIGAPTCELVPEDVMV